jgi:hypothetical protein
LILLHILSLVQDPILLLDPSCSNHVSSFWMVHRQSRRFVICFLEKSY